MTFNPPPPDEVPPAFTAKSDQWSAFIRGWVEELRSGGDGQPLHVTGDTGERMLFGMLDLVEDGEELSAFAIHCIFTLAANVPSEELVFP